MKKFVLATLMVVFTATLAAAQSYQIRSGDTLQVEVLEDPTLNRSVLVLPDGTISFPFAGSIRASGRSAGQVGASIKSGISSQFASEPNVFVTVQELRQSSGVVAGPAQIDVFMMGEITSPGEKQLARGTTLIQALAETGGFTSFAATKRIVLRRTGKGGKQSVMRINYRAIADGAAANDVVLRDGDVIIVPERRLFE